ncbi:hypothetical protein GCM10025779_31090 [Arthrobacter cryoconiti]
MGAIAVCAITSVARAACRIFDKYRSDKESTPSSRRNVGSDRLSLALHRPHFLVHRRTKDCKAYSLNAILSLKSMARKSRVVRICGLRPHLGTGAAHGVIFVAQQAQMMIVNIDRAESGAHVDLIS